MLNESNFEQAAMFVRLLQTEVDELADSIEEADRHVRRAQERSFAQQLRRSTEHAASLRARLYEAHRQIQNLHKRFTGLDAYLATQHVSP